MVSFDPHVPAQTQDADYDCSQESCEYMLRGWGRTPDDAWMTADWIAQGIMTPAYGLMDSSGAGMAQWVNQTYGMDGLEASNVASVDFDGLVRECDGGWAQHGIAAGGRAFYHWIGVRGYDPASGVLLLHNSAPGYMGVGQTLTRSQFNSLGPWSFVRVLWPTTDEVEPEPPLPPDAYAPPGSVGSGLMAMMQEDGTIPAMPSTFLPLGSSPAEGEWAWGLNGVQYVWHLPTGRSWRYRPDV